MLRFKCCSLFCCSLFVLHLSASALAAAAAAATEPAPTVVVGAQPAPEPLQSQADVNIDRGLLLPTAMMQPAGSLTYNNYELLFHGLTYAPTEHVQISLTALPPIVEDMPLLGIVAVKAAVLTTAHVHLALQGQAGLLQSTTGANESAGILGVGALASVCLTDDCASLASASASYDLWLGDSANASSILYGGSIVARAATHVKFLLEVASARGGAGADASQNLDGILASYGLRFYGGNIAGDIAFVKPILFSSDSTGILLGLPFFNFSYRWQ